MSREQTRERGPPSASAEICKAAGEVEEPIGDKTDVNTRIDIEISQRIVKTKGADGKQMWQCTECGKIGKFKTHLRSQFETHLKGFVYTCDFCEKEFKTRKSLHSHKSIKHLENSGATAETKDTHKLIDAEIELSGAEEGVVICKPTERQGHI